MNELPASLLAPLRQQISLEIQHTRSRASHDSGLLQMAHSMAALQAEMLTWPETPWEIEARISALEERGASYESQEYESPLYWEMLGIRNAAYSLRQKWIEIQTPPDAEFTVLTARGPVDIQVRGNIVKALSVDSEIIGRLQIQYDDTDAQQKQIFLASADIEDKWQRHGIGTMMAFAILRLFPAHHLGLSPRDCGNTPEGDDWSDSLRARFPYATGQSEQPGEDAPDPLTHATRAIVRKLRAPLAAKSSRRLR